MNRKQQESGDGEKSAKTALSVDANGSRNYTNNGMTAIKSSYILKTDMKSKIEIKTLGGSVLFELETENNTTKRTVEEANLHDADLHHVNLYV